MKKILIEEEINFLLTLVNQNGNGEHYAYTGWEVVRDKLRAIIVVDNSPSELEPVLAKIEHINSLGKSSWYEVVYLDIDGHWRCYAGGSTFKDGEKVVKWRYCKDCC